MRGRWNRNKKETTEAHKSISMSFLKQHGYLSGVQWGGLKWTDGCGEETGSIGFRIWLEGSVGDIRFQYTYTQGHGDHKERLDYPVKLVATPCRYGGKRWWFICPLTKNGIACRRRILKLYLGGEYFGCRHCYELTYQSCQKHDARVDRLCEDPALIRELLKSKDWSQRTLALKALFKRGSLFL